MAMSYPRDLTQLLAAIQAGRTDASDELFRRVYDELNEMARCLMARELPGRTLSATALVHEAYLRLVGDMNTAWQNRAHFFGAAGQAMRRILVDEARRRHSAKRGVGRQRATLSDLTIADETPLEDLLDLDDALRALERLDARKAQIVTLRFFSGLTVEETASALDLSPATVKNDWSFARAWLHREVHAADTPAKSGDRA